MAEKKGAQEKKQTAKRTHKMDPNQRERYGNRTSERKLRRMLKRNGPAAVAKIAKAGDIPMATLSRLAGESTFAGEQAKAARALI